MITAKEAAKLTEIAKPSFDDIVNGFLEKIDKAIQEAASHKKFECKMYFNIYDPEKQPTDFYRMVAEQGCVYHYYDIYSAMRHKLENLGYNVKIFYYTIDNMDKTMFTISWKRGER